MDDETKQYLNNCLLDISVKYEEKVKAITEYVEIHLNKVQYKDYQQALKDISELKNKTSSLCQIFLDFHSDVKFIKDIAERLRSVFYEINE